MPWPSVLAKKVPNTDNRMKSQNKKSCFRWFLQSMYVKIFFCKTSYKAVCGRFVTSDVLQNGMRNVNLLSFTNMDMTRFAPEFFR